MITGKKKRRLFCFMAAVFMMGGCGVGNAQTIATEKKGDVSQLPVRQLLNFLKDAKEVDSILRTNHNLAAKVRQYREDSEKFDYDDQMRALNAEQEKKLSKAKLAKDKASIKKAYSIKITALQQQRAALEKLDQEIRDEIYKFRMSPLDRDKTLGGKLERMAPELPIFVRLMNAQKVAGNAAVK